MSSGNRLLRQIGWINRSSTLRLTLLLSVIFAFGMVVAILVALTLGHDALIRRVDSHLANLAAAVEIDDDREDIYSVLVRPLSQLADLPPGFAEILETGIGTVDLGREFRGEESWRAMVARDNEGTPVLVAVPLDDSEEALEVLGNALWTTTGFVLVIVVLIGLGTGLLAQRRLARINGVLQRLGSGDLKARTGTGRSADDLDELARQLDNTAAELERLVAQTRNLSASLAHDLRTPLARLRARLETLPESEERGAALEEASHMSGVFDAIMRVARIEAAHGDEGFENVDLGDLASELAETFGPVVEDNNKSLSVKLVSAKSVFADKAMLVQAMANLIQNAIVHGGPDVELFADARSIGVADNGEGVDPALYDEIIKPMVRLDSARQTEGTGLGLALVRAVADRHNGLLELTRNTPKGLRATVKFTDL
ncbi:Signal transduction histidine kinase [Hoeflea phototrophica DFL-43]|uniref:histidine kinase n=1 Tax=Hoeflea phototrophica (strain DSM 17068 / NCIMB 14078 / DFL-43) TaxID=411684 RepID=A9D361_HOEPD|nr:HAMP domain-containing sensor histidine kinase [Hoeflea phototrophica]EDQ34345.2 Signal transduction histidine kinase [Hoeflea phototrophica DFL-43]